MMYFHFNKPAKPVTPVLASAPAPVKRVDPPLPSKVTMAKNLINSAAQVVKQAAKGDGVYLTEEAAKKRLTICNDCEFFRKADQRCSRCGCWMAIKTYLKAMQCPVLKW